MVGIDVAIGLGRRESVWNRRLAIVLLLVAFADWLLYLRPVGLSAVLFLTALAVASVAANPVRIDGSERWAAMAVIPFALAPALVQADWLSVAIAVAGVAWTVATLGGRGGAGWRARLAAPAMLIADGAWRAISDLRRAMKWRRRTHRPAPARDLALKWALPLGLGAVFLALFVAANPLIERWVAALDLAALISDNAGRAIFWLLAASLVWPFVFLRRRRPLVAALPRTRLEATTEAPRADSRAALTAVAPLFGDAAILRSLILFNALFAIQSALDVAYLWGGVALPDGMTYAAYAHRGAYPLIATALLAGAFTLVAARPGSTAARSPAIRGLVFLWVAQNVMLVVSSMLRLDLYVQAYSLTELRVAAFVWMLLVACGLVLVVARLALDRSNAWLLKANALALGLTLYACSFPNFSALIAGYNVAHSREISGAGPSLDLSYLVSLGPHAIPAMDRFVERAKAAAARDYVLERREALAVHHLRRQADWRAWSWRDSRLSAYLAATVQR